MNQHRKHMDLNWQTVTYQNITVKMCGFSEVQWGSSLCPTSVNFSASDVEGNKVITDENCR